MLGAGGFDGSSTADSRHQQHHQAGAFPAASAGSTTVVHPLGPAGMQPDQHAGYYSPAQHAGYQQWLPAQFAQFQLGGYPGGTTFYGPPGIQGMPGVGMPGGLGAHSVADPGQPYSPGVAFGMAGGGLHPDAAPPRGWGGIQLQQQQDRRGGGAHGHSRGARGPPHDRGRAGSRGGARGGRGQHMRGGPGGLDGLQEVLQYIKRLPPEAPIDDGVLQLLHGLDSRGLAALIKDLGRGGLPGRAAQLFDRLRGLGPASPLAPLLDEFSFTALISNCVGQQDLARAMALAEEMRERGIERNVHTFSALMNVCIKCGQYKLALEVYRDMQAAGCPPNVVTYNTLIDVYGKSGQWEEALDVLAEMKRQRVPAVTRTYNTLMIACNTSNQWQESLRLHEELSALGLQPNTTTFNALISAHSKSGDLPKVLQVFKEMVQKGCERSVITYSTLISACEKAGEWELALQLFEEMRGEGCVPNVISYNSLITACAQGAQWEKAAEVFEAMQRQGCRPDVVTFTALIAAFEKGGQWRRALAAFEEMRRRPCPPDAIVYAAIVDALWDTGLACAQRRAAALHRQAAQEGLTRSLSHECAGSLELSLHSATAGVALLSLHSWLHELHAKLEGGGPGALPPRVVIVVGRGKAREAAHGAAKDCVTALLRSLRSPFREGSDSTPAIARLEASGQQVADWLAADAAAVLTAVIPPADEGLPAEGASSAEAGAAVTGEAAAAVGGQDEGAEDESAPAVVGLGAAAAPPAQLQQRAQQGVAAAARSAGRDAAVAAAEAAAAVAVAGLGRGSAVRQADPELEAELATEARVAEAFSTVQFFEETHCLNLQAMAPAYTQQRPDLVALGRTLGARLALPDETVHDAVLLLDRAMSAPLQVADGLLGVAAAACLAVAAEQAPPSGGRAPSLAEVAGVTGVLPELLAQVRASVVAALAQDTAAISALRCLRLYLERLGGLHPPAASLGWSGRGPFRLLVEMLSDPGFLNFRPSVVAAAGLIVDRRSRGLAPYWPSALAQLTGYAAQASPELAAAVAGAQRLHDRLQVPAALLGFKPTTAAGSCDSDGGTAGSAPPTPGANAQPAASSAGGSASGLSRVPSAATVPLYAPTSAAGGLHPAALAAAMAQLIPGSPGTAAAGVLADAPSVL